MSPEQEVTLSRGALRGASANRVLLVAVATVAVVSLGVLSFLPGSDKHILHTRGKYHSWGHLLAFMVVAYLFGRISRSLPGRIFFFVGSLIIGLGIEFGEHLIYRNAIEWKDILVDSIGVMCGTILAMLGAMTEN